jgi:hypothetical protein
LNDLAIRNASITVAVVLSNAEREPDAYDGFSCLTTPLFLALSFSERSEYELHHQRANCSAYPMRKNSRSQPNNKIC